MANVTYAVSDAGVPFAVRKLAEGERYGLDFALVSDATVVEFFDMRYPHCQIDPGRTVRGQFVSRYYAETIRQIPPGRGLILDGGVHAWQLDGATLDAVRRKLNLI